MAVKIAVFCYFCENSDHMKAITSLSGLAILLSALVSCSSDKIHVSPDGNDMASGSWCRPVKTLDEAIMRARSSETGKTIMLGRGTWNLTNAIALGTKDSGIRIIGRGTGRTIISGGIELPAFSVAESRDGHEIWTADLSELFPECFEFQQLYVNGKRAVLARTPNEDGNQVMRKEGDKDRPNEKDGLATSNCYLTLPTTERIEDGIGYGEMQLDPVVSTVLEGISRTPAQMRVCLLHKWDETIRTVDSISVDGSRLFFKGKPQKPWNHVDESSQFILENDIAFLDHGGEWFYDRATHILYYIPEKGEKVESTKAIIPVVEKLLSVKGSSDRHVKDVSIEGISFQHTSFLVGPEGRDPQQSGGDSNAAVEVRFADGFTMEDCEIVHTGNNGIWLEEGCRDCSVTHCRIHDLGIGGVKIGSMKKPEDEELMLTRNITVDNCIIQGGSRVLAPGAGVLLFNASDCAVTHNEISDFCYTGISVGWNWGYAHSPSKRNDISYNHIHHLGWGLLSDMGGIYTLGPSEGTTVTHNVIHHIYSLGYGGWGLYPDEGSTGIVWECNLVHDCKSAGFHLHYGKENIVRNNLFVNQFNEQLAATRIEEHTSFRFVGNIIAYSEGEMYSHSWPVVNSEVRDNLYWRFGGEVDFNGFGIEEWKKITGKDEGSFIADPGFVNLAEGDYRMTNSDVLEKIGFKQFDWTEAGVYGSEEWKRLAELDKARTDAYSETVRQLRGL